MRSQNKTVQNEHVILQRVSQIQDTVKYVPMRTGSQMLRSGAHLSDRASVEGNKIIYPGPYARYLYEGKVMAYINTL